jgi:hypothetical protein
VILTEREHPGRHRRKPDAAKTGEPNGWHLAGELSRRPIGRSRAREVASSGLRALHGSRAENRMTRTVRINRALEGESNVMRGGDPIPGVRGHEYSPSTFPGFDLGSM